jgi:hypothetical protein
MAELTLSCVRLRFMLKPEFKLLDEELHTIYTITRWLELFHLFNNATRSSPSWLIPRSLISPLALTARSLWSLWSSWLLKGFVTFWWTLRLRKGWPFVILILVFILRLTLIPSVWKRSLGWRVQALAQMVAAWFPANDRCLDVNWSVVFELTTSSHLKTMRQDGTWYRTVHPEGLDRFRLKPLWADEKSHSLRSQAEGRIN